MEQNWEHKFIDLADESTNTLYIDSLYCIQLQLQTSCVVV